MAAISQGREIKWLLVLLLYNTHHSISSTISSTSISFTTTSTSSSSSNPSISNTTIASNSSRSSTVYNLTTSSLPQTTFSSTPTPSTTTTTTTEATTTIWRTTSEQISYTSNTTLSLLDTTTLSDTVTPQEYFNITTLPYVTQLTTSMVMMTPPPEEASAWPIKREAVVEGDLVLGGLMMVHERQDLVTCGPIMPQGGIQALETMLYTVDRINSNKKFLPGFTLGAYVLDDCDKDTYGLEMAVDFIKGVSVEEEISALALGEFGHILTSYDVTTTCECAVSAVKNEFGSCLYLQDRSFIAQSQ